MGSFFESVQKEIALSLSHMDKIAGLGKNKNVNVTLLKQKLDKDEMANFILEAIKRTESCVELLKNASSEVELNQKESKAAGNKIILLQCELLCSKTDQINRFQSMVDNKLKDTIKTEMKTYSDAVKKDAGETLTIRNIKTVVKDIVKNGSEEREKNLIVFGVPEDADENLNEKVGKIFSTINVKPRFNAAHFGRIEGKRPVRVTVDKTETVFEVLKVAKNLKQDQNFNNVFIGLDKSPEERAERRKLVQELKKKIADYPNKKFFIRRGEICCTEESTGDAVPSGQGSVTEQGAGSVEKPEWRPPHLKKAPARIKKPVYSESSIDSSDN